MRCAFIVAMCVAVASAALFAPPPAVTMPADFSANITVNMSGEIVHGFMYHDHTGRRTYEYIAELAQYTYTFQPFGLASTTTYTLTTSGCTCQITPNGIIPPYFAELATAKKVGSCTGGSLYKNVDFPNLNAGPHRSYCINGNSATGAGYNGNWYTFVNYAAGRDKPFPVEPLNSNIDLCNQACL